MEAILTRTRSELRSGLVASLSLVVLLGVMGGAVLASAAGARRQVTAYPRFLAASGAPEAIVLSAPPEAEGGAVPSVDVDAAARLPQVASHAIVSSPFAIGMAADGEALWGDGTVNLVGFSGDPTIDQFVHPKLLAGRLPDPSRVDEVAVGYRPHQDPRVHIGATLNIGLLKRGVNPFDFPGAPPPEDVLPPIPVHVVGVMLIPGEITDSNDVFVSAAFSRAYAGKGVEAPVLVVRFKHGLSDFPAFAKGLDAISPGALAVSQLDEVRFVRRSTDLQAVALWLFAALAGVAGLLIFAQALTRQTSLGAVENPTLRALGMTPNQLVAVAMVRAVIIGLLGAVLAIAVAVAASPLTPLGVARLVEPDPGIAFDPVVLGLGGLMLLILVPLLAAWPAWKGARTTGDQLGTAAPATARPSVVADSIARAGLPPTAVAGVRLALEPGRGRSAIPVRSTILGVTLAVAAFAASFVFLGSYQHLLATPRLYGVDFDVGVGNPFLGPDATPVIIDVLRRDPDVAEFGGGNIIQFIQVRGPGGASDRVNVWAFDPIQGSVHPTVIEGRWPQSPAEIALGSRTMSSIHTAVGRSVDVDAAGRSVRMQVVGRAVLPEGGFGPGLGDGAGMSFQGLRRLFPDAVENAFPARLAPGADVDAVTQRLNRALAPTGADVADLKETPNLSNFKRIEALPLLLAGLLALAGAATLTHTLVSSIRRRRRDLAILKTLGFVRRQVSGAVAWQATTLVALAMLLGIPLGIAAGRWGWNVFAARLGVVAEARVSVLPLLVAVPATVLLANLIAILPGRAASRVSPAIVLRTE